MIGFRKGPQEVITLLFIDTVRMKRILLTYLDLASFVLLINTASALMEEFELINLNFTGQWPFLMTFIFVFSFFNMFILFVAGILNFILRKNILRRIIYLCSSFFFLFFFMGLSNWDRF